jgi:hypothetical protein
VKNRKRNTARDTEGDPISNALHSAGPVGEAISQGYNAGDGNGNPLTEMRHDAGIDAAWRVSGIAINRAFATIPPLPAEAGIRNVESCYNPSGVPQRLNATGKPVLYRRHARLGAGSLQNALLTGAVATKRQTTNFSRDSAKPQADTPRADTSLRKCQ